MGVQQGVTPPAQPACTTLHRAWQPSSQLVFRTHRRMLHDKS